MNESKPKRKGDLPEDSARPPSRPLSREERAQKTLIKRRGASYH